MQNWEKLDETLLYEGRYRNFINRRFRLPDGKEADFEVMESRAFAVIMAFTEDNKVLLVRQFRPGSEQIQLAFPAGSLDTDEDPATCAQRELLEEKGYKAADIRFVKEMTFSYGTGSKSYFLATGCRKVQEQQLDPYEYIDLFILSIPEFRKLLRDPNRNDVVCIDSGYLALDLLGLL